MSQKAKCRAIEAAIFIAAWTPFLENARAESVARVHNISVGGTRVYQVHRGHIEVHNASIEGEGALRRPRRYTVVDSEVKAVIDEYPLEGHTLFRIIENLFLGREGNMFIDTFQAFSKEAGIERVRETIDGRTFDVLYVMIPPPEDAEGIRFRFANANEQQKGQVPPRYAAERAADSTLPEYLVAHPSQSLGVFGADLVHLLQIKALEPVRSEYAAAVQLLTALPNTEHFSKFADNVSNILDKAGNRVMRVLETNGSDEQVEASLYSTYEYVRNRGPRYVAKNLRQQVKKLLSDQKISQVEHDELLTQIDDAQNNLAFSPMSKKDVVSSAKKMRARLKSTDASERHLADWLLPYAWEQSVSPHLAEIRSPFDWVASEIRKQNPNISIVNAISHHVIVYRSEENTPNRIDVFSEGLVVPNQLYATNPVLAARLGLTSRKVHGWHVASFEVPKADVPNTFNIHIGNKQPDPYEIAVLTEHPRITWDAKDPKLALLNPAGIALWPSWTRSEIGRGTQFCRFVGHALKEAGHTEMSDKIESWVQTNLERASFSTISAISGSNPKRMREKFVAAARLASPFSDTQVVGALRAKLIEWGLDATVADRTIRNAVAVNTAFKDTAFNVDKFADELMQNLEVTD